MFNLFGQGYSILCVYSLLTRVFYFICLISFDKGILFYVFILF